MRGGPMKTQTLNLALKSSELVVQEYVKQLEAINAKLQKQIAKLECDCTSYKHKIASIQSELNKRIKQGHTTVEIRNYVPPNYVPPVGGE